MLGWFKKSAKNLEPIDFSDVRVDIHSHLIPGIDDGARDLDDSIAMIKELKNQGFSKIITTPHIMSDLYKNTPEIINSGLGIDYTINDYINETNQKPEYILEIFQKIITISIKTNQLVNSLPEFEFESK